MLPEQSILPRSIGYAGVLVLIDKQFLWQKMAKVSSPRELHIDTSTMSACSRGTLSRALRFSSLRTTSQLPCRVAFTIPTLRNTASIANSITRSSPNPRRCFSTTNFQQEAAAEKLTDVLPICCPGCGAFSQTVEPDEPGYYGASRKQNRKLLASRKETIETSNKGLEAEMTPLVKDELEDENTERDEPVVPRPTQGIITK